MTLQFLWGSTWTRSNPISHKTIWHILDINNIQYKLKKCQVFLNPFLFFIYFLDNTSHKFWDQSHLPHYQSYLQESETVSWHRLRSCYTSDMLQHLVWWRVWIIFERWTIPKFPEIFPGIALVSIIYLRYCRCYTWPLFTIYGKFKGSI